MVINVPDMGIYTPTSSGLVINTWHLVVCWKDVAGAESYLQIDDDPIISGVYAAYDNPDQIDLVGQPSFANNVDTLLIDEMLLINRVFTQDERDYLWNNGTGRTLFP